MIYNDIKGLNWAIDQLNMQPDQYLPDTTPCIYCLIKDGNPVYIGMSMKGAERINQHRNEKDFDCFRLLQLPGFTKAEIYALESMLIAVCKPPLNKAKGLSRHYLELSSALLKIEKLPTK